MKTIQLQPVESEPIGQDFRLYPHFVIGRLLKLGIGKVEAERPPGHEGKVDFIFTSHLTGKSELVGSVGAGFFRSVLARFGPHCGSEDMLYSGHTLFACEHDHAGQKRVHRFSLFVGNVRVIGFWVRLYLYQIDGVWPVQREETAP